jgi:hypothetical protein
VQLPEQFLHELLGQPLDELRAQVVPLVARPHDDPAALRDVHDVERGQDLDRLPGDHPGHPELRADLLLGGGMAGVELPGHDAPGQPLGHLHRQRPDLDSIFGCLSAGHLISLSDK